MLPTHKRLMKRWKRSLVPRSRMDRKLIPSIAFQKHTNTFWIIISMTVTHIHKPFHKRCPSCTQHVRIIHYMFAAVSLYDLAPKPAVYSWLLDLTSNFITLLLRRSLHRLSFPVFRRNWPSYQHAFGSVCFNKIMRKHKLGVNCDTCGNVWW